MEYTSSFTEKQFNACVNGVCQDRKKEVPELTIIMALQKFLCSSSVPDFTTIVGEILEAATKKMVTAAIATPPLPPNGGSMPDEKKEVEKVAQEETPIAPAPVAIINNQAGKFMEPEPPVSPILDEPEPKVPNEAEPPFTPKSAKLENVCKIAQEETIAPKTETQVETESNIPSEANNAELNESVDAVTPPAERDRTALQERPIMAYVLEAIALGMYVFPCKERGKEPATSHGFLDSTNDPSVAAVWWMQNPNLNWAVDLGRSNLVVWDYDTVAPYTNMPPTFRVKSGRVPKEGEFGGVHDYYRGSCDTHSLFEAAVEPITERDEVDKKGRPIKRHYDAKGRHTVNGLVTVGEIRSRGAYVIGWGSVHPSGQRYEITNNIPLAESPEQNVEEDRKQSTAIGTEQQEEIAAFVEEAFDEAGIDYLRRSSYKGGFKWLIDCPWEADHTGGKNIAAGGSSSAVFMAAGGGLAYKCQHAHCESTRDWNGDDTQPADPNRFLRDWMETKVGHKLPFAKSQQITMTVSPVETDNIVADPNAVIEPETWMTISDLSAESNEPLNISFYQTSMTRLTLRIYGKHIRYVTMNGKGDWMRFNGKFWVKVDVSRVRELIRKASEKITDELIPNMEASGAAEIAACGARTEDNAAEIDEIKKRTVKRVELMRKLVASCHDITFTTKVLLWMREHDMSIERFNLKDWKVNFNNGTWNAETGEFGPFDPDDFSTVAMSTSYNPSADCPTFKRMLANMFDNPEMSKYLLRYMGYALLGTSREKDFQLWHGRTNNGKTTLLKIMAGILGQYAQQMGWDTLSVSRSGQIRNDLAALHAARFVYADEGSKDIQIAEEIVKALTGGGNMTARFLNHEFFTFPIKFKMVLSTNNRPTFSPTDEALWIRIKDIHMRNSFSKGDPRRIENLDAKLWAEREGIAQLMVEGAKDYMKNGLGTPVLVVESTKTYREELDSVELFVRANCRRVDDSKTPVERSLLHSAYNMWAQENDHESLSIRTFNTRLLDMGFIQSKTNNPRTWMNIELINKPINNQTSFGGTK